jgi:hypothetical protein
VIDLSTGKDIDITREPIIGTVPIYQAMLMGKELEELKINDAEPTVEKSLTRAPHARDFRAGEGCAGDSRREMLRHLAGEAANRFVVSPANPRSD